MSPDASEFAVDNRLSKTLLITYTTANGVSGSVNYPITIINDVRSIAMHSTNHKVSYNLNESLDLTNAEIKITRAVGTADVIALTDSMVSGFASNVEIASLPLTVSYTENGITKTTSYNIEVKDTVTQIVLQNPPSIAKYGEELDLSGTTIEITKGSGPATENVTTSMITGYDKNT